MIDTERLTIQPLTLDQLRLHVADNTQLETELGLIPGHRKVVEPLLSIITHFTVPRLKDPELDPLYHTIWIAWDRQTRHIVADAKFKGEPDETGTVEIGYGTYPAFQSLGYMTEVVRGLVDWVGQKPGVLRVMADTDVDNLASQRVLQKNGFTFVEETEGLIWWQFIPESRMKWDARGYLVPYERIPTSLETVRRMLVTNDVRVGLWATFEQLLSESERLKIPILCVWLDGSYASLKTWPNDIDMVIFVEQLYHSTNFGFLNKVSARFANLHVFWVGSWVEPDKLQQSINEIVQFNWQTWFNSDKDDNPKGFLEIKL
ncbi:MAG: N-acetyltransferase [Cytophagales bacterium]|nr:MAG: N-acetyltransferase [Cytophagales bacterium]